MGHYGSGSRFPTIDPTIVNRNATSAYDDKRVMAVLLHQSQPAHTMQRLCIPHRLAKSFLANARRVRLFTEG
jgi:hypothetical protein